MYVLSCYKHIPAAAHKFARSRTVDIKTRKMFENAVFYVVQRGGDGDHLYIYTSIHILYIQHISSQVKYSCIHLQNVINCDLIGFFLYITFFEKKKIDVWNMRAQARNHLDMCKQICNVNIFVKHL